MAEKDSCLKALNAIVRIQQALNNTSSGDSVLADSLEKLRSHFLERLRQKDPIALAQYEKQWSSGKRALHQDDMATQALTPLLDIWFGLDVKDISFDEDAEKKELRIAISHHAEKEEPREASVPAEAVGEQEAIGDAESAGGSRMEAASAVAAEVKSAEEDKPVMEGRREDVPPDDVEYVTLDQEQMIDSDVTESDDRLSENISVVERIFARMNAMEGAIEAIPSDEQVDLIRNVSRQAADWIKKETVFTPEYKKIALRLRDLVGDFIGNGYYAAAVPIISVFGKIDSGVLEKDEKIREFSAEFLNHVASDSHINILFKEINLNEKNRKTEAGQIFSALGDIVITKLLAALRNAGDSKVRISIIHIIQEMGQAAIPAIGSSINSYAPWYYLRNLAYLLGRIGDEKCVEMLKPLLLHSEKRVRAEAFKSICQTGGRERGPALLSVLPEVDNEMRVNIIELFGKIKYEEAVPDMQDMLKSKTSMSKSEQTTMQEKICNALGAIGSLEAIKTLTEVAESKSFLGLLSYPTEVKYAAKRALDYIKRK